MSSDEAVDAGQKAYHHGDLRRAIIDTALDTLQEQQGWQFTLREIARRANVSHSAPYRHFPDKAALLHELALIGFDRLNEDLAASVDRAADAPAARARLRPSRVRPAQPGSLSTDVCRGCRRPTDIHLDPRVQAPFLLVVDILEHGQRAGTIRPRAALGQATACWAHLHGLTMLAIDGRLVREGRRSRDRRCADHLAGRSRAARQPRAASEDERP